MNNLLICRSCTVNIYHKQIIQQNSTTNQSFPKKNITQAVDSSNKIKRPEVNQIALQVRA